MTLIAVLELIVLIALVALTAFVSSAEISLTSLNRIRVRRMVEEEVKGAERLEHLLEERSRFLPVILFLTLLITFAADSLATTLAVRYLGAAIGHAAATVLATLVMASIIFIYGEVAPKTAAGQRPERVGLWVAGPIGVLTRLIYPLTRAFIWAASPVVRLLGGRAQGASPFVTEEEIKTIVTVGEEEGVIEEVEKEMIHSIFEFGDTIVREVMVPRTDMQTLEVSASLAEAFGAVTSAGHSRIPVWEESLDNVVGILYAKDLLAPPCRDGVGQLPRELLRAAYFVPETKKVSELLRDMRTKKIHMAIAVDEYGGIAGLVTIEDLIEEIIGEIQDEFDIEEPMVEELPGGGLRVDARLPLDELAELTAAQVDVGDVDSVGGLVLALAGDIPNVGDTYELAGLTFTVEKAEGRRVQKVLIDHARQALLEGGGTDEGGLSARGQDASPDAGRDSKATRRG